MPRVPWSIHRWLAASIGCDVDEVELVARDATAATYRHGERSFTVLVAPIGRYNRVTVRIGDEWEWADVLAEREILW